MAASLGCGRLLLDMLLLRLLRTHNGQALKAQRLKRTRHLPPTPHAVREPIAAPRAVQSPLSGRLTGFHAWIAR